MNLHTDQIIISDRLYNDLCRLGQKTQVAFLHWATEQRQHLYQDVPELNKVFAPGSLDKFGKTWSVEDWGHMEMTRVNNFYKLDISSNLWYDAVLAYFDVPVDSKNPLIAGKYTHNSDKLLGSYSRSPKLKQIVELQSHYKLDSPRGWLRKFEMIWPESMLTYKRLELTTVKDMIAKKLELVKAGEHYCALINPTLETEASFNITSDKTRYQGVVKVRLLKEATTVVYVGQNAHDSLAKLAELT